MSTHTHRLTLASPDETAQRAAALARVLVPGDTILLCGGVGAGKTHFARALIQSILDTPEDVPSPTFTLVQIYDTVRGPLWHADLYRLGATSEIEELGLSEAFDTAICIVEWPDRLGDLRPGPALEVTLEDGETEQTRILTATWQAGTWDRLLKVWQA